MKTFAVLQLSGCAGCEVSLLNADAWIREYKLVYMPLVISAYDVLPVDVLLVSGGVRTDEDLYNLHRAARRASQVVAVGTCAISGGVPSLGDREEVRDLFLAEEGRRHVPRLSPRCHPLRSSGRGRVWSGRGPARSPDPPLPDRERPRHPGRVCDSYRAQRDGH